MGRGGNSKPKKLSYIIGNLGGNHVPSLPFPQLLGREGKGGVGEGREWKGREGKGREGRRSRVKLNLRLARL